VSRIGIALLAWCCGASCPAQEKVEGTVGGMLNGYLNLLAKSCPKHAAAVEDAKASGDIGAMVVTRQMYQTMCVCHPAKTRTLLASLPKETLAAKAEGENAFLVFATPGIQDPCVGEQLHSMFEGKTCDGFKSTDIQKGTSEPEYCACMKREVADISDTEAARLFRELSQYNARYRAAKTNNLPRPEAMPRVDRYITTLKKCGGGGEFID
jgi:hypothetical protein